MPIALILFAAPVFAGLIYIFRSKKICGAAAITYAALHLACTAMIVMKPSTAFGDYFAPDSYSIIFLVILSVVFAGVAAYNFDFVTKTDASAIKAVNYTAALLLFTCAMSGAVLTKNLGLMWVFIEATTLASAYLIYFKGGKHALEAAWKYIFICSIGIAFAFVGIIFLSMSMGAGEKGLFFDSLNKNAAGFNSLWLKLAFVFMVIGFGTKAGLAPVHAWLPDAHSEAPSPVSAMLSATLLNSAMLVIIRIYSVMNSAGMEKFASFYLTLMGALSVFVAAVYLLRVGNYKRMLAYSSIENMGLIAIALSLGKQGIVIALIQAAGHSLAKASFFLTSGSVVRRYGTKEAGAVTGLLRADTATGWLWILSFFMISAVPPSPLFISEFLLLMALLGKGMWPLALFIFILLTVIIYSMASVVFKMASGRETGAATAEKFSPLRYAPQFVFMALLFAMTAGLLLMKG